ncbi:MAG TPA: S8 family serine peptidase [Streptosporangiaceae bacterium]
MSPTMARTLAGTLAALTALSLPAAAYAGTASHHRAKTHGSAGPTTKPTATGKPKPSGRPTPTTSPANTGCAGTSAAVSTAVPWAQQQLRQSSVWDLTEGAGQTVAVLDSGVSATAPALASAVLPGLDVATGKPASTDCAGHGTFVAGLIAARPTAGSGFAGVAPQAQILPVNVINSNGDATPAAVAAGIDFALAHGATVIDVCPAVTPGPSPTLAAAVATALARNVVVIAPVNAAGVNNSDQTSYPAAYPGVVAVSVTDSSGTPAAGARAGVRVDLAAPGSNVTSIGPLGPGEITASGAALATGFVAGTAALVRSYYPRLSQARVVQRLEATANPPGDALPDPQVGYGIVAPYTAVTTVLPGESGGSAPLLSPAPSVHLAPPVRPDRWPITAALLICAGIAVGLVVCVAGSHILRHGRRRGWRPPVNSA